MNLLLKTGCRIYQTAFRAVLPVLPYRQPVVVEDFQKLKTIFKKKNISSLLVVSDDGIVSLGLLNELLNVLDEADIRYTVFKDVKPNPTVINVEDGLKMYIENNCEAIIAVGGGSIMDCGKAIGARAVNPKRPLSSMRGILRVIHKLPPFFAVPTTAGTGSEVTLAAVIVDPDTHDKYAMMDFPLIPSYAVLDPKMTETLPPSLTASTGMDALTHAIEAYIGRSTTKETRRYALEAVSLIFDNILKAYENGHDIKARSSMSLAAYKAGISFSMSYVGYIHAVAHSLGGMYDTPHGLANAVIMPYVLEMYGDVIYKKLHEIAIAAHISDENEDDRIAALKLIRAIRDLNHRMNIPEHLSCIKEEDIPSLASHAAREANPLYPVPVIYDAKELEKIYYLVKGE